MQNGFIKVAAFSPKVRLASCAHNAGQIITAASTAAKAGAHLLVLPELSITGYSCGDLFLQKKLLDDALQALLTVCKETCEHNMLIVVGLPLCHHSKLYNCAAVIYRGKVMGLVPKTHLPNCDEFSELRNFTPAFGGLQQFEHSFLCGLPFGTRQFFSCLDMPAFTLGVEICEDLSAPAPPSTLHAIAGATVIANLSATNQIVGRAKWRKELVQNQSGRLVCAYICANAGMGESTTDLVFAGQNIIAENGSLLFETKPFEDVMAFADVDVESLVHQRQRLNYFKDSGAEAYNTAYFSMPITKTPVQRKISQAPFVPDDPEELRLCCQEILQIQTAGLAQRLRHTGVKTAVIGVSGGLDSSLALLATTRAFNSLNLPLTGIAALTMPGFGTSGRTLQNAQSLCKALGLALESIDITSAAQQHFASIAHSPDKLDVVYENTQARLRTLTLMSIANQKNGIVVGTGDLSELALGWATYNGDHMSMYAINATVPKTLVRHLIAFESETKPQLAKVLLDILNTPISPELLPLENGNITQETEEIVGPYELHDFFLFYALRWGFTPKKILFLANKAFGPKYSPKTIIKWMKIFYSRFFSQQFKRSCLPDGPKVGTVSLSPRDGFKMPSDACAEQWLLSLDELYCPGT